MPKKIKVKSNKASKTPKPPKPRVPSKKKRAPDRECRAWILSMVKVFEHDAEARDGKALWPFITEQMDDYKSSHLENRSRFSMNNYYSMWLNASSMNSRKDKVKSKEAERAIRKAGGAQAYLDSAMQDGCESWWWDEEEEKEEVVNEEEEKQQDEGEEAEAEGATALAVDAQKAPDNGSLAALTERQLDWAKKMEDMRECFPQ